MEAIAIIITILGVLLIILAVLVALLPPVTDNDSEEWFITAQILHSPNITAPMGFYPWEKENTKQPQTATNESDKNTDIREPGAGC